MAELNWDNIRNEFENTPVTLQQLAEKYNISPGTVRSRKHREHWEKKEPETKKEPGEMKKESGEMKKEPGETKFEKANKTKTAAEKKPAEKKPEKKDATLQKGTAAEKKPATQHKKKDATLQKEKKKKEESKSAEAHAPNLCGAKTRQGTMCKNPAGFKTNHFGTGRCYLHGGRSTGGKGGPYGNKKGLKTGAYEAIWLDTLPEEEQKLYYEVVTDKVAQLDQEIRLLDIRERRMLQRIEELKQQDFTVVEILSENGAGVQGPVDKITEKRVATLSQIQAIEEALTKVQARKERLLDLKHKFEQSQGLEKPDVGAYIEALRGAAKEAWQDENGDY